MYALKKMVVAGVMLALIAGPGAFAQSGPSASARVPAAAFDRVTAREVAARLTRATGVLVVVDRTVASLPVTVTTTGGSLEATLARIVAALPAGVALKRVYIPTPAAGATAPDGDRISDMVMAQEALAGRQTPDQKGAVNLQGRWVAEDKAAPVIAALDLKPVYLITNPNAANDPIQRINALQTEGLRRWLEMTPEQQMSVANQQLDMLMNMDPALRRQLFSQQRQVMAGFMQRIMAMPEEQRTQFFRDITGGAWDGKGMPPGAGGGGQGPGR